MSIITDKVAQCPTCHQAKHLLNMLSGSEQCEAINEMINNHDDYQLDNGTLKKKSGEEWLPIGNVTGANCGEVKSFWIDEMGFFIYFVKDDGKLYTTDFDVNNGNVDGMVEVPNMTEVREVFPSYYATFILKNDGTLWSKGMNGNGQLGVGDTNDRDEFTEVIMPQGLVITGDDVVNIVIRNPSAFYMTVNKDIYGVGYNNDGQMGTGDTNDVNVFTKIDYGDDVKEFYFTEYFATNAPTIIFAVKNDGTLWGHGDNQYSALGTGNTDDVLTPTQISNVSDVKSVKNFGRCTYVIKNDGSTLQCPYTSSEFVDIGFSNVKEIHESNNYLNRYLITSDDKLYGYGNNQQGQLGLGDNDNRDTWTYLNMDDIAATTQSYFGGIIFAFKNNGDVYSTGLNSNGMLGLGDEDDRNVFTLVNTPTSFKEQDYFAFPLFIGTDNDLYITGWANDVATNEDFTPGMNAVVKKLEITKTVHDFVSTEIDEIIIKEYASLFKLKNGEYYMFIITKKEILSLGNLGVRESSSGDSYSIEIDL